MRFMRLIGASVVLCFATLVYAGDEPVRIPPPSTQLQESGQATAVFAGGCFWGVQGVFQHVDGVLKATSGYAGGSAEQGNYESVSSGRTGHAEAVQVIYNPSKVSYGELLQIFFSVVHDPTQLNKQGPDRGTQYRSAIFPTTEAQAKAAKSYIAELNKARVYDAAMVTKVEGGIFYRAEDYHQDFLVRNPTDPYIVFNDLPKVAALKSFFSEEYRAKPVLVLAAN